MVSMSNFEDFILVKMENVNIFLASLLQVAYISTTMVYSHYLKWLSKQNSQHELKIYGYLIVKDGRSNKCIIMRRYS